MSLPLTILMVTYANQGIGLEVAKMLPAKNIAYHIIMTGIGGDSPMGPWAHKEWRKVFDINVFGTFIVTDSFLPLLARSEKTKRIVFVSSELGSLVWKADPLNAFVLPYKVYAASMTAMNMMAVNRTPQYAQGPTTKINVACPGHCAANLTDFQSPQSAAAGAVSVCGLAMLGHDGETGTFSNSDGHIPWYISEI